jgi:hypothetical protein
MSFFKARMHRVSIRRVLAIGLAVAFYLATASISVYHFSIEFSARCSGLSLDHLIDNGRLTRGMIELEVARYTCQPLADPPNSPQLVVSLTTFPDRVKEVPNAIYSLMIQSFHPDVIVLWLSRSEFRNQPLPDSLLRLTHFGLTIKYVNDNIHQYLKLIPALREYPESVIATFDDDLFYRSDCLEKLVNSYHKNPRVVHAHTARLVSVDTNGSLRSNRVVSWKWFRGQERIPEPCPLLFPEGMSGVLYPPHVLHPDVMNMTLAMRIAPWHDDLWFWVMNVRNNGTSLLVDGYAQPAKPRGRSRTRRLSDINNYRGKDVVQNDRAFAPFDLKSLLAGPRRQWSQWF